MSCVSLCDANLNSPQPVSQRTSRKACVESDGEWAFWLLDLDEPEFAKIAYHRSVSLLSTTSNPAKRTELCPHGRGPYSDTEYCKKGSENS